MAVIEYKITWIEMAPRIRWQSERDSRNDEAYIQDMIAILRHSGGLSTEKATETVIIENNRKIMEWIKGEVVTGRIQPSGARTSNSIMDQIDIQEINNIYSTRLQHDPSPVGRTRSKIRHSILYCYNCYKQIRREPAEPWGTAIAGMTITWNREGRHQERKNHPQDYIQWPYIPTTYIYELDALLYWFISDP